MNKQIESLKMAIEALDNACMKIEKWTKGGKWTAGKDALNACKEALAEAESESSSQLVAWYGIGDMHVWKLNLEEDKDATLKVVNRPLANNENWKPLYTHPATWQSLSDDEIQKTWYNLYPLDENNLWTDMLEGEHLRKFARAIEKAHGIGVKDGQTL